VEVNDGERRGKGGNRQRRWNGHERNSDVFHPERMLHQVGDASGTKNDGGITLSLTDRAPDPLQAIVRGMDVPGDYRQCRG